MMYESRSTDVSGFFLSVVETWRKLLKWEWTGRWEKVKDTFHFYVNTFNLYVTTFNFYVTTFNFYVTTFNFYVTTRNCYVTTLNCYVTTFIFMSPPLFLCHHL